MHQPEQHVTHLAHVRRNTLAVRDELAVGGVHLARLASPVTAITMGANCRAALDSHGQLITINGHGFDGRSHYNKASVGGFDCPILTSRMDEKTKDGYMVCKAPDGVGSDVKIIEVEVFDYFQDPPTSVKGFCCKVCLCLVLCKCVLCLNIGDEGCY